MEETGALNIWGWKASILGISDSLCSLWRGKMNLSLEQTGPLFKEGPHRWASLVLLVRPVLILMYTIYKCQLETLQMNPEVRNSFSVKLGTSVSKTWKKIPVYSWEISLFFWPKMSSQVIECQDLPPQEGRGSLGPQSWSQAIELLLWGYLCWRSQTRRIWKGRWWSWLAQTATWQVGMGISSRGDSSSHRQASWELGWILAKGWGAFQARRDEVLPLPESGLNPSAEMFSRCLLGPLASWSPSRRYTRPSFVFLLSSVVHKYSIKTKIMLYHLNIYNLCLSVLTQ